MPEETMEQCLAKLAAIKVIIQQGRAAVGQRHWELVKIFELPNTTHGETPDNSRPT